MNQKYSIELTLPLVDAENATEALSAQLKQAVEAIKALLGMYKKAGVEVPSIAIRFPKTSAAHKEASNHEFKEFSTKLIDHLLKYMPKENIPAQMKVIKALFASGRTAEQLIELFDDIRTDYPLTTWHTVRYKLVNATQTVENKGFERKELDTKEAEDLKARLKTY